MRSSVAIKLVIAACLAAGLSYALSARAGEGSAEDRAAIEATARDYVDGWYEGDAERIARALHPDLTKRRVVALPDGSEVLNTLSQSNMVTYTKAGYGKKNKKEGQHNEVIILDVMSNTASVKTITHEFIDYIHMAKINGQWRIVNVLWETVQQ